MSQSADLKAILSAPSIHCEVYRQTTTVRRGLRKPWVSHAWFAVCKYDWGTVSTLCHSWQAAVDHAKREVAAVTRRVAMS